MFIVFGITAVSENSELNYIIDLVTPEEQRKSSKRCLHYEEVIGLKYPQSSSQFLLGAIWPIL